MGQELPFANVSFIATNLAAMVGVLIRVIIGARNDPMTDTANPSARVFTPPRAIGRVLQIVKAIAQWPGPVTLAELSSEIDVPRTSLFAILKGLQAEDYVIFEREHYSLGPAAIRLGAAITQRQSFPATAMPVLEKLAEDTGETVILSVLAEDRRHVVYVSVLEAKSFLRFAVNIGTRRPLNASATGQAVLSYLPRIERERYLASASFEKFTPKTLATATALRKAVAQVRRQHCAMTVDGTVQAAVGIAAPYFGQDGLVLGAVNIAGPTSRLIDRTNELKKLVVCAGENISRILGCTTPYPPPEA